MDKVLLKIPSRPQTKIRLTAFTRKNRQTEEFLPTRLGPVPLKVSQVRGDVSFYPSALNKGPQTERALTLAIAEMYIQGVSTRKAELIIEREKLKKQEQRCC